MQDTDQRRLDARTAGNRLADAHVREDPLVAERACR